MPGPFRGPNLADINYLIKKSKVKFVWDKHGFPAPVDGAHTLEANTSYIIIGTVDLEGGRLIGLENSSLFGFSPEVSILKSTGFDDTDGAFITTARSLPCNLVAFHDFGTEQVLDIDGTGNIAAYDWNGVNFVNCSNVGTVQNVSNFVGKTLGFLNSGNLTFDGTVGTIGVSDTLWDAAPGTTSLIIPATVTITRRLRITYSAFVNMSGETGINLSASATVPDEGYILDTVNFSGGGTYITGVDNTSEKALFSGCRGITNTSTIGHLYMQNNATTTTATTAGTFYKVAGTTTAGPFIEKFEHTNGRLTCTAALSGFYQVTISANVQTSNNTNFSFRAAKNGTTSAAGEMTVRQQSNTAFSAAVVQDVFLLNTGDYIEPFVSASQNAQNILVADLNILIKRLN